jgi:hypothetical protein
MRAPVLLARSDATTGCSRDSLTSASLDAGCWELPFLLALVSNNQGPPQEQPLSFGLLQNDSVKDCEFIFREPTERRAIVSQNLRPPLPCGFHPNPSARASEMTTLTLTRRMRDPLGLFQRFR